MQKVVICGQSELTLAVAARLLQSKQELAIGVYASDADVLPFLQLEAVAAAGSNNVQRATPKVIGAADVLVLTDYVATEGETLRQANLAQLRNVLKEAMAAGFAGKVIIAAHDDALLTYFAQRFSGLAKATVMGLGTLSLTRVFEKTIATALAVPMSEVTAYAAGTATDFVLIWSRAYVAATPVLSLIKTADGQPAPLLDQCLKACQQVVNAGETFLWPLEVERLLAAFAGQGFLAPVSTLAERNDKTLAYARPMLIDQRGAAPLATLTGSEDEEAELAEVLAPLQATIDQIESGSEKDEA